MLVKKWFPNDGDGDAIEKLHPAVQYTFGRRSIHLPRLWQVQQYGVYSAALLREAPTTPPAFLRRPKDHARRLKTLRGVTPYEYLAEIWTEEPDRFNIDPYHHSTRANT